MQARYAVKLKISENSLFAILMRSRWWISIGVAVLITLIAAAALPRPYLAFGICAAIPFFVIGILAAYKQAGVPSEAQVTQALQMAGSQSWRDLSGAIEEGFRRDGYEVVRVTDEAADFIITKANRATLVSGKRWKAAKLGAEPLRALAAAMEAREIGHGLMLVNGEVSDSARRLAESSRIRLVRGVELARLCGLGR
jgi:restriction system protein